MNRLEWEVCAEDGMGLEHGWEFKYLGCVLDESGIDEAEAECSKKVVRVYGGKCSGSHSVSRPWKSNRSKP